MSRTDINPMTDPVKALAKEYDYKMRCASDNAAYFTAEEAFLSGAKAREEEVAKLKQANADLVAQANKILGEKTKLTFDLMAEVSKGESMQQFHEGLVKQLQRAQEAYSKIQEDKLQATNGKLRIAVEAMQDIFMNIHILDIRVKAGEETD